MAEIKLNSWDINEAIEDYLKKKYKLDIDITNDLEMYPCLEYTVRKYDYKKFKNGKYKTDKDGYKIIDDNTIKYETEYAEITEDSKISFYIY